MLYTLAMLASLAVQEETSFRAPIRHAIAANIRFRGDIRNINRTFRFAPVNNVFRFNTPFRTFAYQQSFASFGYAQAFGYAQPAQAFAYPAPAQLAYVPPVAQAYAAPATPTCDVPALQYAAQTVLQYALPVYAAPLYAAPVYGAGYNVFGVHHGFGRGFFFGGRR